MPVPPACNVNNRTGTTGTFCCIFRKRQILGFRPVMASLASITRSKDSIRNAATDDHTLGQRKYCPGEVVDWPR